MSEPTSGGVNTENVYGIVEHDPYAPIVVDPTAPDYDPTTARVKLVEAPYNLPGHCVLCGISASPTGFADPNLLFEFFGSVYFCRSCVGDIARVFGYLDPEVKIAMQARIEALEAECAMLRNALVQLENAVDSLTSYHLSGASNIVHPDSDPADDEPQAGTTEPASDSINDDPIVRAALHSVTATGDDATESVSGEGPTSVPSDPGSNDDLSALGL